MNRSEFVKLVSERLEKTQKETKEIIDMVEACIVDVIKEEDELKLNIGKFKGIDKEASVARNPKDGTEVQVPAKRVAKFAAGKVFKDGIN